MVIYAMLGTIMFTSKIIMEVLPNIHLLGTLTVVYTVVLRKKALIPIYVYVFLNGLYGGFSLWWVPYLYIWTVLWGAVMLLPKNMPRKAKRIIFPIVSALHGITYGILYAPAQAIMFGLDFKGMLAWVAAGISFDVIHCVSNFALGFLILPLSELLAKLMKRKY